MQTNLNTLTENIANNEKIVLDLQYQINKMEEVLYTMALYKDIQEAKKMLFEYNNSIAEWKKMTLDMMLDKGLKKVEMFDRTFTCKESPGAIKVTDESLIPEKYFIEKTSRQLDKAKLKEGIKDGDIVPGASIEKSYSLIIKFTKDE